MAIFSKKYTSNVATSKVTAPTSVKDAKERVTVVVRIAEYRIMIISKSTHSWTLKGIKSQASMDYQGVDSGMVWKEFYPRSMCSQW